MEHLNYLCLMFVHNNTDILINYSVKFVLPSFDIYDVVIMSILTRASHMHFLVQLSQGMSFFLHLTCAVQL